MRLVPEAIAVQLDAAAAVFADQGFDQTRIEDLAAATGVPRATLYYYFSGKEDILAWLLRRTLTALTEAVATAAAGPGTGRERLEAVITAHIGVMGEHPDVCRALMADAGRAGRIPNIAASIQGAYHQPVRRLLAEGAADGSLRPVADLETAVSTIYGATAMAGMHFLVADNRLDAGRVAVQVITLLIGGLGAEESTVRGTGRSRAGG